MSTPTSRDRIPTIRACAPATRLSISNSAVKIALFDKHQLGYPDKSGIEVEVLVRTAAKPSRRHKVRTLWRPEGSNPSDPKYKYDKLTIVMTCPRGGWIGTAAWKYTGASRFTQYTAKYRVPDQPERDEGQIIFIFNGLESLPNPQQNNPPGILQPVLQWTSKDKWAIRSWYVPSTYTPTFDEMPELNDERPFTNPASPAWTKAEKVRPGTLLQGVIAWDGMAYRSKFMVGTTSKVELFAPNILPLRYPVAVIEAFEIRRKEDPRRRQNGTDRALS